MYLYGRGENSATYADIEVVCTPVNDTSKVMKTLFKLEVKNNGKDRLSLAEDNFIQLNDVGVVGECHFVTAEGKEQGQAIDIKPGKTMCVEMWANELKVKNI